VFDKLTQWQGGGMGEVMERRPSAELQVAWREEALALYATLTAGERELWDAVESGAYGTGEIARRMEVSAARVSQLRRQVMEKARG
jgi:FixJ family two-component response regulator